MAVLSYLLTEGCQMIAHVFPPRIFMHTIGLFNRRMFNPREVFKSSNQI